MIRRLVVAELCGTSWANSFSKGVLRAIQHAVVIKLSVTGGGKDTPCVPYSKSVSSGHERMGSRQSSQELVGVQRPEEPL